VETWLEVMDRPELLLNEMFAVGTTNWGVELLEDMAVCEPVLGTGRTVVETFMFSNERIMSPIFAGT
jgi:hypothetical protein